MQANGRAVRGPAGPSCPCPVPRRPSFAAPHALPGPSKTEPGLYRCRGASHVVHSSSSDSNPSSQSLGLSTSFGARKISMPGVAEDGPAPQAAITFRLKFKTSWGQGVKLIGSHASLGAWSLDKAVELRWIEGDFWTATVTLPAGCVYEYKYVVIDFATKQPVMWQSGGNAVLAVDLSETKLDVKDNWNNEPGAEVRSDGQTGQAVTRESKLQKWAGGLVSQYKAAVQENQQLIQWAQEGQAIKGELTRVKMELSMMQQAQRESDLQVAALKDQNTRLQQDLMHARQELNASFAEALKLLTEDGWEGGEGANGAGGLGSAPDAEQGQAQGNSSYSWPSVNNWPDLGSVPSAASTYRY